MPQHELLACAQCGCFAFSCFEDFAIRAKSYAANSAWQQLNVLAHNLCRSFQLDTIAETKGISRKRTCTHLLNTIRTIRSASSTKPAASFALVVETRSEWPQTPPLRHSLKESNSR